LGRSLGIDLENRDFALWMARIAAELVPDETERVGTPQESLPAEAGFTLVVAGKISAGQSNRSGQA